MDLDFADESVREIRVEIVFGGRDVQQPFMKVNLSVRHSAARFRVR